MAIGNYSDIISVMNPDDFIGRLSIESDAVAFLIIGIAILIILLVNRKPLKAHILEWRSQRSLKQIGCEQIRNLVCSDGLDGYHTIDRLALTQDSILLISYKPYSGNIYCAEGISEWIQVVGQKSFKFTNPLFELENQLTSLKLLIIDAPLHGYLFFNRNAEFPKGHPDRVLQPGKLPNRFIAVISDTVNPQIRAAWELLKAHQKQAASSAHRGAKT